MSRRNVSEERRHVAAPSRSSPETEIEKAMEHLERKDIVPKEEDDEQEEEEEGWQEEEEIRRRMSEHE